MNCRVASNNPNVEKASKTQNSQLWHVCNIYCFSQVYVNATHGSKSMPETLHHGGVSCTGDHIFSTKTHDGKAGDVPMFIWWFPEIGVPPIFPILVGFSLMNHVFWGFPIYGNLHMTCYAYLPCFPLTPEFTKPQRDQQEDCWRQVKQGGDLGPTARW